MSLSQVTDAHARRQKRTAEAAAKKLARMWRSVNPNQIVHSWQGLLPNAIAVLTTAQATAAASANSYVDDALEAQGTFAAAEGAIRSGAFAGIASDGRPLDGLLYQPVVQTLLSIKRGETVARARAVGLLSLDTIVRTQVADAGRTAESVAITARPTITGYVRMLNRPSCARCIILAGKFFRWNTGFQRHPRCDCRHIPARENVAGDLTTNPRAVFNDMSKAEQDKVFTKAGADALRDGADINQIVNARRGMDTASVFGRQVIHTREGVTRFGSAGQRMGKSPVRLMPEQIYKDANGNRGEAIRLLRKYGYIL